MSEAFMPTISGINKLTPSHYNTDSSTSGGLNFRITLDKSATYVFSAYNEIMWANFHENYNLAGYIKDGQYIQTANDGGRSTVTYDNNTGILNFYRANGDQLLISVWRIE